MTRPQPDDWQGRIGRTVAESEPHFPMPPTPEVGSPNVVIVVLDDTGFAQLGCYGSDIDTPHIDRLAASGLQFTNFHVTPLCSPTRASLLTGRSHHAVGMRALSNFQTGFPNQQGHISDRAATIAEVVRNHGYATFCVGKWHLAPLEECSAAGPFDQWPLARGFDRFYGFLEGETDQFYPDLVCDNHQIDPPARPDAGYHLSEDLVDQLLRMLSDSVGVRPDRPFFAYLAFGATHAPHQAPAKYLDKYRGRFDQGWDVVRQRWYEQQLETGVIPQGTQLAPRNPGVEPWDQLSDTQQSLAIRLQEAFAAFLDHTDDQIGRVIDGLEALGQLDNTILIVMSDNGASQEGGPFGVMHEMKFFNGILETPEEAITRVDEIGTEHSHTNYPWGWAQCGNAPFKWYKGTTHEGGVHVPMIMHWPDGIGSDAGGHQRIRDQFTHVCDVAPTIYDLLGLTVPNYLGGVEQMPVTGRSFASAISDSTAPATNTLQYFEMFGSRALVEGDWKAVCHHDQGADYDTEQWELYHLSEDRSECVDLSADHPEQLASMIEQWWREAQSNGVLPLDDRIFELFGVRFRDHSPHSPERHYVYRPPMSPMPMQASAAISGRSFDLTARVVMAGADHGVLYAMGTSNSGMSVFVQDDRLVVDYNAFGDHTILRSTEPISAFVTTCIDSSTGVGHETKRTEGAALMDLVLRVRRQNRNRATLSLAIAGVECGSAEVATYLRIMSSVGASVGYDHGSPVSQLYSGEFPFTGALQEVDIQLISPRDGDIASKKLAEAQARAEMARQ